MAISIPFMVHPHKYVLHTHLYMNTVVNLPKKCPGAAAPRLRALRGAEIRGRRGHGAARRGLRAELQAPRRCAGDHRGSPGRPLKDTTGGAENHGFFGEKPGKNVG